MKAKRDPKMQKKLSCIGQRKGSNGGKVKERANQAAGKYAQRSCPKSRKRKGDASKNEEEEKESDNELIELFEKVKKELEARKKETEELRGMIETENSKHIRKAEAIRVKLEKEKQELRDY